MIYYFIYVTGLHILIIVHCFAFLYCSISIELRMIITTSGAALGVQI